MSDTKLSPDFSSLPPKTESNHSTAYLSNEGRYTLFRYGGKEIRIIAPRSLERYIEVTEWDRGYLVVQTKYSHSKETVEEYLDLVPVLEDLYMDADSFLDPIQNVEVAYG